VEIATFAEQKATLGHSIDPQYNTKFLTGQPQAILLDIFLFILSQWLAVLETG